MANKPAAGSEDSFAKARERSKKIMGDAEEDEKKEDDGEKKSEKKSKSSSGGGRKQKSPAERRADEFGGKRNRGRPGTGDFLGGRGSAGVKPAKKVVAEAKTPPAPAATVMPPPSMPVRNPARLANAVMAEQPMGGGGFLDMMLGRTRSPVSFPGATEQIGLSSVPRGTPLPPIDVAGRHSMPSSVGVQSAEAAPPPKVARKPKTEAENKKKDDVKKKETKSKDGEKKKSTKDRLADDMEKEDKDYYEQSKRGRLRLG